MGGTGAQGTQGSWCREAHQCLMALVDTLPSRPVRGTSCTSAPPTPAHAPHEAPACSERVESAFSVLTRFHPVLLPFLAAFLMSSGAALGAGENPPSGSVAGIWVRGPPAVADLHLARAGPCPGTGKGRAAPGADGSPIPTFTAEPCQPPARPEQRGDAGHLHVPIFTAAS